MKAKFITLLSSAVAGLVVGGVVTLVFRGHFISLIITLGLGAYVGLPLLVLACLAAILAHFSAEPKLLKWAATIALACVLFIGTQAALLPAGAMLLEQDIDQAKTYCENLVPLLEAHRAKHGTYPEELGDLVGVGDRYLPRLLRSRDFYSAEAERLAFGFCVRGFFLDLHFYSSEDRQWGRERLLFGPALLFQRKPSMAP